MKKSAVMKSAVMALEISQTGLVLEPGLNNNMSGDQMRMGRVSSRERRMPRGAGRASGRMRASVAIGFFPQEHGDSHREVIEGSERHRHACDGEDGLVANNAAQT